MSEINWEQLQSDFLKALLTSNQDKAVFIARQFLSTNISMVEFFQRCITPSLVEIGERFENLDIFLPELVEAANIVENVEREIIQPEIQKTLSGSDSANKFLPIGKVLLATVQGDLHDIGKNMVATMLKVNRFEVVDAGANISPREIIERARREEVDIIGLSALLTTTLPYMKDVIDLLVGLSLRNEFKVIVGGAAVTPEFAKEIQADGYGRTAVDAVQVSKEILSIDIPIG